MTENLTKEIILQFIDDRRDKGWYRHHHGMDRSIPITRRHTMEIAGGVQDQTMTY